MSVDDGNLTSMCMRVVAFLPLPHPPPTDDCARAQSVSTRLSANDLSHPPEFGWTRMHKRERERKRAILDEFSIPGILSSVSATCFQYLQVSVVGK